MVYDEVFGPTRVITPRRCFKTALAGDQLLQPEVYVKAPVHTSILATNKRIHSEALDTLYRERVVRGSITEFKTLLHNAGFRDHVRRIEIYDYFQAFRNHRFAHMLLAWIQTLPQIRSTTILSDRFAFTQHNRRSYITVCEFAAMMQLGEAVCVNIGRFELRGRFSHIRIVHRKLVKMWPDVASTPEDYDVYADVLGLTNLHGECIFEMFNVALWAAHTSLRRWVGLYDELLRGHFGLDPYLLGKSNEQLALLGRFVHSHRGLQHLNPGSSIPSYARYVHESKARHRLVKMLRPSDGPEMLTWATDLLSVNITAFYPSQADDRQAYLQRTHWADTDGGMHTLDFMKMHMLSALRGDVDALYVSHPVFPKILEYTAAVQSLLTGVRQQIQGSDDLTSRRIRQFYLLQLAMNIWRYPLGQHQQAVVDDWSLRLFRRYLLADPSVREAEAYRATLEDMRTVMGTILGSFMSPEPNFHLEAAKLRRMHRPAIGLDPDLVPALAWEYGRLFVKGWRDMLRIRRYLSINSICGAA